MSEREPKEFEASYVDYDDPNTANMETDRKIVSYDDLFA